MASYFILLVAVCFRVGYAGVTPLSDAEKQEIVDSHNEWRKNSGATAMRRMKWNSQLAAFAEATAAKCAFEHTTNDQRQNIAGFDFIGENIYVNTAKPTFKESVDDWGSEIKDYNLASNQCSAVCGHYTQITWAKTSEVGCAIAQCGNVAGFDHAGYLLFCNYGIGGNMQGEKPFEKGTPGSKCQAEFNLPAGADGLCGEGGSESSPTSAPDAGKPTGIPDVEEGTSAPDAERPSGAPPSERPTDRPASGRPSGAPPGGRPTGHPDGRPSDQPGGRPTGYPDGRPTGAPGGRPTGPPGGRPTDPPGGRPTGPPGERPSGPPGGRPTDRPDGRPSGQPGGRPTGRPDSGTPEEECKDNYAHCQDWSRQCGRDWTKRDCRKTCNFCGNNGNENNQGNDEDQNGECKDDIWFCNDWLQDCDKEWAKKACRKSCKHC